MIRRFCVISLLIIVSALLVRGWGTNLWSPGESAAPVHDAIVAIDSDDERTLGQVLQRGVSPDAEFRGMPLLTTAIIGQRARCVHLLLNKGAAPDLPDLAGHTPLGWAVRNESAEVVHALLEHRADVNARGAGGYTALMWAAATAHVQYVRLLLDAGAMPDAASDSGKTAAEMAEMSGYDEVVRLLRNPPRSR